MGLADFFKGRRKKKESALDSKQVTPRCAYYIFPHVVLRQFAFGSPYMCMGALGAPEGQGILKDILASVAEYCQREGEEATLTCEQIRVHRFRIKRKPCLVLEMPEPRAATEVFFVGIVLSPPVGNTAADLTNVAIRYFTLEIDHHTDGIPGTVLCEWTFDNKHLNLGNGPLATVKKFVESITDKCEGK